MLEAMRIHGFMAEGSEKTRWDLYFGFGVIISGYLLVQAIVLWQLGSMARTDPLRVRPIVASFVVAFPINAVLAWQYVFAVPAVMAVAIAICLALAPVTAGRTAAARQGTAADIGSQ